MKNFFILLFSINGKNILNSRYNYNNLDLTNVSEPIAVLDTSNEYDLNANKGICEKIYFKNDNVSIDIIHDNYLKDKILKILLNENVSVYDKLLLIKNNNIIIKNDDILDEWNNIF
tara:strand:- start:4511 stop:4858 length:348 start_codon:yes stop_codon:yes gene_type:complete